MRLVPLTPELAAAVKPFTDEQIGVGYYALEELAQVARKTAGHSWVLQSDEGAIYGLRLTYPPGMWHEFDPHIQAALSTDLWPAPKEKTGYFKSLFLSDKVQRQGWGQRLCEKSISGLRSAGAQAVLCHSWKESPGNSSQKFLSHLGFKPIAEHPRFWNSIDYQCTRCGPQRCVCTAIEMALKL